MRQKTIKILLYAYVAVVVVDLCIMLSGEKKIHWLNMRLPVFAFSAAEIQKRSFLFFISYLHDFYIYFYLVVEYYRKSQIYDYVADT